LAALEAPPFSDFLSASGGEAGQLIASRDWSQSPLGPIETWPPSLRTALAMILLSPVPIVMLWGVDGVMLYNDAYSRFAGGRHPRLLGSKVREGWPEVADFNDHVMRVGLAGGRLAYRDQELTLYRHGVAEQVWMNLDYSPVPGEDGRPAGVIAIVVETTQRVLAERRQAHDAAALLASEERLRLATEAAEIGLWDVDPVTDTLYWPPRVKAMFGISPDRPVNMTEHFYAGLHPEDREWVSTAYAAAIDPERRALYDVEYRTVGIEDGVVRWVAAKGRGVFDEHGRCVRVIGTAIDITRRKADEARLRELNETLERRVAQALAERRLFAEIVDSSDVLVLAADRDFRWLAINRAAADTFVRLFGVRRPQVGESLLDLLESFPDDLAAARTLWSRALAGEEFVEIGELGDPARERRCFEIRVRPLRGPDGAISGAYQLVHDVTDRLAEQARLREAEAALQQAQKMEAVGQLTGGIAHDFNNLLQGVAGSLDLIRRRPGEADRVRRWAEAGLNAVERGAKLTGQLLAFSRAQRIEAKPLILADLVAGMREMLERTLGPLVTIRLDLRDGCAPVLSDRTQIEMAVLNLAINARDAMKDGGTLTIATNRRRIAGDAELAPGEYVELSVADTGAGMTAEVAARAFDPFFTTKPQGQGTGLGLSQVYGIARQGGGTARIESRPGGGTTVRVFLRRTEQAPAESSASPEAEADRPRRRASVLVIDDDPDVRRFLVDSLESLGYRVQAAEDGPSALAALERERPDVMVVDFAMPGMTGAEVARLARERLPDLPIVFASGYSDTAAIERVLGAGTAVLRKPFRVADLQEAVADALARD